MATTHIVQGGKTLGRISKLLGESDLRSALLDSETAGQVISTLQAWDSPPDEMPI